MAVPENIGALLRALQATPAAALEDFDPFGTPPPFAGRLEMIGLGKTEVEDAYEAAMAALEGCSLFTRTQAVRLISYFVGDLNGGGGNQDRAKHTIYQAGEAAARPRRALRSLLVSEPAGHPLRQHGKRAAALAERLTGSWWWRPWIGPRRGWRRSLARGRAC